MKYVDGVIEDLGKKIQSGELPLERKVHQLRVATKRLRSIWRLLREHGGLPAYKDENARLRSIAARFAEFRDRQVAAKLVRKLNKNKRGKGLRKEFKRVQARLNRHSPVPTDWEPLLEEIRASAKRLNGLSFDHQWLRGQIEESLKQSRREFKRCLRKNSRPTDFHRWRRRSKNLMYQIEFANSLGLSFSSKSLEELRELTDDLGEAHDHQILYKFLVREKARKKTRKQTRTLQRKLERKSLAEGQRFKLRGERLH